MAHRYDNVTLTYLKYKCVEVTECKLYMRVDDTNNYKRDNPVSMTRRIQNTECRIKKNVKSTNKVEKSGDTKQSLLLK
jgi:hypothetical protein